MQKASGTIRDLVKGPARAGFSAALSLSALFAFICVVLILGLPGRSQSPNNPIIVPQPLGQSGFSNSALSSTAAGDPVMAERRRFALNIQRQKQIVADSDKLLRLAQELNDEVATAGSRSLTDEQLEKLNQIGKLARSVKDRMLDTAGQPTPSLSQPLILYR